MPHMCRQATTYTTGWQWHWGFCCRVCCRVFCCRTPSTADSPRAAVEIELYSLYSLYSRCRALQLYSVSTVYSLYTTPLTKRKSPARKRWQRTHLLPGERARTVGEVYG